MPVQHSTPVHRAQIRAALACTGQVQAKQAKQQKGNECVVFARDAIAQGAWAQDVGVQGRVALGVGPPGVCAGAEGLFVRS